MARSGRVWGATEAEMAERYACDDLGFPHDDVYFRALTIDAPPALVFRWVCQLRAGPYSYDLVDNLGRRSPPRLTPGLDELRLGQRVMKIFRIAAFAPPEHLTIASGLKAPSWLFGDVAITYRIRPTPGGTRLVAKLLLRYPEGLHGRVLAALMPSFDLLMFRKQLQTLRRYAERDAREGRESTSGSPRPSFR